ncbi:MAG: 1,4-dihydroxy-2-naphthoate polyprenyltransferase [Candidatus Dormibacteraeota bacterium]|nr:1,4-dihydroxy-2-naphthoate polyprenyltransferase [Candidatus Dormibacteraeota bacterium]
MEDAGAVRLKPPPSRARVWWMAARPATLAASVSPVLAGTAIAVHDHAVRTLPGLGALVVAIAMQVGVNYANDYSDHVRGTDRQRVGPLRAASSGVVPPEHVKRAAIAAFAVAAIAGVAISLVTDWRLLLVGALAVAAGWLYTGGPRPYGYIGLGELFVFVFFGLFATVGTTYVHELRVPAAAWVGGVATGCLACAILALNNLRDIATDAAAGKRTLAVRVGAVWTRRMIAALFAVALLAPLVAGLAGWVPRLAALPVLVVTMLGPIMRAAASGEPKELVGALQRTAVVEVWWALLWTLGLLVAW